MIVINEPKFKLTFFPAESRNAVRALCEIDAVFSISESYRNKNRCYHANIYSFNSESLSQALGRQDINDMNPNWFDIFEDLYEKFDDLTLICSQNDSNNAKLGV